MKNIWHWFTGLFARHGKQHYTYRNPNDRIRIYNGPDGATRIEAQDDNEDHLVYWPEVRE